MINRIQDYYIELFSLWIPFVNKISPKIRQRLITALFVVDVVLFCVVRYVLKRESYFYNTICGMFLILAISILSLGDKLERKPWRKSIFVAWFGMCLVFCISDFFVFKKACGLGVILAYVFTGVFFVWQNNKRKDLLWKAFKDAIKMSFILMAILSMLFRPFFEGGRYAGIFTNPNTFGLYLFVIFAIYMSDVDWNVGTGKTLKKSVFTYIQVALVLFYLSISQARTAFLAVGAILLTWIICRIYICVKEKKWKNFLKGALWMILFTVGLYPLFYMGTRHIPHLVGHPIMFSEDVLYLSNGDKIENISEIVLAEYDNIEKSFVSYGEGERQAENITPEKNEEFKKRETMEADSIWGRIANSIDNNSTLNELSSGRITIYKAYIQKFNVCGHKRVSLNINGKKVAHAHNNYIQFAYSYGVICLPFYLIMTMFSIIGSVKFFMTNRRKNATYAFLIPGICIGFVVATMTECLFLPFEMFPAFAYWFAFGDLFEKKSEDKE